MTISSNFGNASAWQSEGGKMRHSTGKTLLPNSWKTPQLSASLGHNMFTGDTEWDLHQHSVPAGRCEFVLAKGVSQFSTLGPLRRPLLCYYTFMAPSHFRWDCFQASVFLFLLSLLNILWYNFCVNRKTKLWDGFKLFTIRGAKTAVCHRKSHNVFVSYVSLYGGCFRISWTGQPLAQL